jgi:uncharacterized membrane protein
MAEVVVIGYPDETTAQEAYAEIGRLEADDVIETAGVSVVHREADGTLKVTTPTHATVEGARGGALWGGLFGLLFFVPVFGIVMGGIFGAIFGKLGDMGIKDEFRAQVQGLVKPDTSALVLVFTRATADRALAGLAPLGGQVLRTSLSHDAEEEIQKALDAAREQPPAT